MAALLRRLCLMATTSDDLFVQRLGFKHRVGQAVDSLKSLTVSKVVRIPFRAAKGSRTAQRKP